MKLNNKHLAALGLSAVLVAGLVGAQTSTTPDQTTPQTQNADPSQNPGMKGGRGGRDGGHGHHGGMDSFGDRGGMGGFGFRGLALDTKMTFNFYDADPASGATTLQTLEFTYGIDSEAAFAEQFQTARASATFMKVDISEQTRTVDLSTFNDTQRQDLIPRELARPGVLNDGSTITATFYNADPENGGTVLETLTFTQGTSSEAGFADDFSTAAQSAAFVKITTSPQSKTVDFSAMPQRGQGFGPGEHHHGFGQGQGFGPDMNQDGIDNVPTGPATPSDENNSTPDSTSDNS
jgi:hypothetical protein